MAEFYSLEIIRDKDGRETVDFGKLSFILRRIQELISNLDASQKTVVLTGALAMSGNGISGGPQSQQTAKDTDFITKGYLRSAEAAELIAQAVEQTGNIES